jgi:hypothetical protein
MKLVFFLLFLQLTLSINAQSEWVIELSTKMPDSRMGVWTKGNYTILLTLDSIYTHLQRSQQGMIKAIEYYSEQDSNFINYYEATANRYNEAARHIENAKDGFDLQTLVLYEGREDVKQNNSNSRILESYIKQLVEQGDAPVFFKGMRIYTLCCSSELRDEGQTLTFSDILNRGYETRIFFDQPDDYIFYEYRNMGW